MRRRFVLNPATGRLVEVAIPREPPAKVHIQTDTGYEGLRSSEGHDLSTRKRHREYMQQKGYAMMSDFAEEWREKAAQRADFFTTGGDHEGRLQNIEEAIDAVVYKKYKPKRYSSDVGPDGERFAIANEKEEYR
jgi:hypothetical protein